MKTQPHIDPELTLAATVSGEDLRVGLDVAVLNETFELPSFMWSCCDVTLDPHELVRLQYQSRDGGTPLRVRAVCLPFVFVEQPDGRHRTIDLRRTQLVRLDRDYARLVRKKLRELGSRRVSTPPDEL
jgi:hypothetical protein